MGTKWVGKQGYNKTLRKQRIGEVNTATCGLQMKIIDYKSASNVDIKFEDGTVVKGKNYAAFKTGNIAHPIRRVKYQKGNIPRKTSNRVGERSIARNGLGMTIIAYRQAVDIDIQFDDGMIVYNKTYRRFKDGRIKHPNVKTSIKREVNNLGRLGEVGKSKEGEEIKIIAYRSSNDIDVQFPDGFTRTGQIYTRFKAGRISRHNRLEDDEKQRKERVGETVVARNGLKATIIRYHRSSDLDIQFEDGTVVKGTTYNNFKKGVIKHPDIKEHVRDYDIKRGVVKTTKREGLTTIESYRRKRLGEVGYNSLGLRMVIIKYNRSNDIDIQFDDGAITEHKTYEHFVAGWIPHPTIQNKQKLKDSDLNIYTDLIPKNKDRKHRQGCGKLNSYTNKRLGEIGKSRDGKPITIIKYNGAMDIDVQFEDGFIVKNTTYDRFKRQHISRYAKNRGKSNLHIGETNIATNGMQMTVIACRRYSDIDVEFADGTIVTNKSYNDFRRGMIRNPNIPLAKGKHEGVKDFSNPAYLNARDKHLGEVREAKCGLKAEIVEYFGISNITVQFEDGVILENINYGQFRAGSLKHPDFSKRSDFYRKQRIGESLIDSLGRAVVIIEYRNYNDIDVQYENGDILKHTTYKSFIKSEQ